MSAKGTSTFIMQRASAVLMAPLAGWVLFNLVANIGGDFAAARAWMAAPINGLLVGAFVTIGALHMRIGLSEVIVDYLQGSVRDIFNFLNWIAALLVISATVYSVFTLSF